MNSIKLNDLLNIQDLSNTKIRFTLQFDNIWNPIEAFKNNETEIMLGGHYWNYQKMKSFKEGQTTIGFIRIRKNDDLWLLFHIGKVTKDLNKLNAIGYEYEEIDEYQKYFGRLIIRYKNKSQNMVRNAATVIDDCLVEQILPDVFDNDLFPGYDKVNISWRELSRVVHKESWKTALRNQKGVYLITDISNGRSYVGSAYGNDMILNRFEDYIQSGHGGNKELKKLEFEHIQNNFRYSVLDIFKASTDEKLIIERENWWKETLMTRKFGYNAN